MNQHHNMPALGMGTFRLEGETATRSVEMALETGFRHIDTAQVYGNEAEVGEAIENSGVPRDDLFVTTKVWTDKFNREQFLPSVHESLEKLRLDKVDLLLIHWPSPKNGESMQEYLGELLKAQQQGLTKHIGVSNFTIANLREAMDILPKEAIYTNQVEVHPYLTNDTLRAFCTEQGIHVTGYMPFAVGKVLEDETINKIADKHGVFANQVVLAWAMAHGMATIPSSTNRRHLQSNFEATTVRLDEEDISAIDKLDRGDRQANPDFAPDWDE